MGYTGHFYRLFKGIRCQNELLTYFLWTLVLLTTASSYLTSENVVFPPGCTSILQPLELGIVRSFKHYWKQLTRKNTSMIDYKFPHDAKPHEGCFGCTTFSCRSMVLCYIHNIELSSEMSIQFKWNTDGVDATELCIAKDDWGYLKAGVPLEELCVLWWWYKSVRCKP